MNSTMTNDKFIDIATKYVNRLLKGICEHQFEIAVQQRNQVIRFVAKLHEKDFDTIKYDNADLYPSIQKIVAHIGSIRRNPYGQSFNVEFKLYDPYFAGLDYQVIEEPDIWVV